MSAAPKTEPGAAGALSATALSAFVRGDLPRAAECLRQLSAIDPVARPRVEYNQAVLRFYAAEDCTDVAPLLAATLGLVAKSAITQPAPPRAAASDLLSSISTPEALEGLRAAAGFVPVFNAAVAAYNGGHVSDAAKLVVYLFGHVEAMEDWLALRTCFLSLDVYLRSGDVGTAAHVLSFLETLVRSISETERVRAAREQSEHSATVKSDLGARGQAADGSNGPQQRTDWAGSAALSTGAVDESERRTPSSASLPAQVDSAAAGHPKRQRPGNKADPEATAESGDVQSGERNPRNGDSGRQHDVNSGEGGSRRGPESPGDGPKTGETAIGADPAFVVERVTPPWDGVATSLMASPTKLSDIKVALCIYAARLSAAHGDMKQLRKEAKSAVMISTEDGQCPTAAALMMKAKIDVNSSKALRVLACIHSQAPARIQAAVLPLLLNNLGVVHHRLGRHALATHYLGHARESFAALYKSGAERVRAADIHAHSRPLSIMARSAESHVSYNMGLQHIQLGLYRNALEMFSNCARTDEVQAARSPMLWIRMAECCVAEANSGLTERPVCKLLGEGSCRRFVLLTPSAVDESLMRYAALCARTAVAIIDSTPPSRSPLLSSDEFAAAAANRQRCSALALVAYASLQFDPTAVLSACNELVTSSRPGSAELSVLGTLYGAEALCMLGCLDEAADRLAPLLTMGSARMSDARDGAFVNAALAHSMRGDMAAATRAAKTALKVASTAAPDCITRKQAIMVAAYVSLREGNADSARQLLNSAR